MGDIGSSKAADPVNTSADRIGPDALDRVVAAANHFERRDWPELDTDSQAELARRARRLVSLLDDYIEQHPVPVRYWGVWHTFHVQAEAYARLSWMWRFAWYRRRAEAERRIIRYQVARAYRQFRATFAADRHEG